MIGSRNPMAEFVVAPKKAIIVPILVTGRDMAVHAKMITRVQTMF